jgi:hypothetical protein
MVLAEWKVHTVLCGSNAEDTDLKERRGFLNVNTVRCHPHNLFTGSKVKIGYVFQPSRWSS